jgi:hypothetical protein
MSLPVKEPTSARARRVALVLVVVAAAHLGGAYLAERERADLAGPFALRAVSAIPVALVPPVVDREPRRPDHSKHALGPALRPGTAPIAVAAVDALAPPLPPLAEGPPAADVAVPEIVPPAPIQTLAPGVRYPINTGYWQVDERWLFLGKTEFYCIDGFNILKFMAQPCNHHYHCVYPVEDVADGKIRFAGVIRNDREKYDVSGGGSYSPTRLAVSVAGAGHYKILPLAFTASLDARFISGDCPPDAKRIHQH